MSSAKKFDERDANIAENVRMYREYRQLNQLDIANELCISETAYSNHELKITRIPSGRLQQIAEILDVPPEYFFLPNDLGVQI